MAECDNASTFSATLMELTAHSIQSKPVIVCPLQQEMRWLRRVLPVEQFDWLCCGPGESGVNRAASVLGITNRLVILIGTAGGLTERVPVGSAAWITEILNPVSGQRWRPTMFDTPSAYPAPVIAISYDAPVSSPLSKRELASRFAADVIDMESVAFAQTAVACGWNWGIVRGVSDGPRDRLPTGVERWVDSYGTNRLGAIAASMLRRPWMIPWVARLAYRAKNAVFDAGSMILRSQLR